MLLARGHSTRDIAQRLVVTPKTAANHIEHIYTKLGISSRAAATLYATQHGLMGAFASAKPLGPLPQPSSRRRGSQPTARHAERHRVATPRGPGRLPLAGADTGCRWA
jgi:Bacterial regulatory proteins, luxR family